MRSDVFFILLFPLILIAWWLYWPYKVSKEEGLPYITCLRSLLSYAMGEKYATKMLVWIKLMKEENS